MPTVVPYHRTIQELLSKKFTIDDYQREYKWERKQIEELVRDLRDKFVSQYRPEHATTDVGQYETYFLGSIIVSQRDGANYLIDGQQRTTSLTLLLIWLYHRLTDAKLHDAAVEVGRLIYSNTRGARSFNLDIPERTPVLKALFEKAKFDREHQPESLVNMDKRYEEIEQELGGEFEEGGTMHGALEHFCYWLIGSVGVIEISTNDDAYAYAIFETMNDRGKPLSPTDMLKAFLLGRIKDSELRADVNDRWKAEIQELMHFGRGKDDDIESNFLKTWLRAQYGRDTRQRKANASDEDWEKIGGPFHRWVNDQRSHMGLNRQEDFARLIEQDIPFFARQYRVILGACRTYTPGLEPIFYNDCNELTLQVPVLLAAIKKGDSEEVVARKFRIVATYLDHYVVRRVVNYIRINYSSVQYNMVQLIKEVRHKSPEELIETLAARLEKDDVTLDSAKGGYRKGLSDFRVNQSSKRYIHYILARLTAFIEKGCDLEDRFAAYTNWLPDSRRNPFEVEHLWPDNHEAMKTEFPSVDEFNYWRNRLAGLVLLPKSKNSSLNAKPYTEKRPHYQGENLLAASLTELPYAHTPRFARFREQHGFDFKPYATFGKEQQTERRDLYTAMIKHIWSVDRLKEL
jgi:uncharacterized protein with ParB-like and HNH nuclease domain